jgi:class 3 adenylate cyclase
MADVFVSYARSTAPRAQAVARSLGSLGYDVWIDDALPSHRAFAEVIEEQIANARAVVVVWSPDAVKSEWVRSEANHGRSEKKLVQVFGEKTRLPMPFDQLQCEDLTAWSGEAEHPAWRKVVASIAELVGARSPTPVGQTDHGPLRDERRHLTVLSCGLADAGKLARLDPEEWRAIASHYRRTAAAILTEAGGHLAASGETLVAYFGYPVAQEHAAQRAVRAGLAIVAAVADLKTRGHQGLAARVGIHAGTVVVSHGGGGAEVFGDAPAVAAAAQAAAPPGAVVVSGEVRDLVPGQFVVEDHGSLPEGAGPLFRIGAATGALRRARGASGVFVGRAEEVGLLLNRWEHVGEGQGQFVLVAGEPGIGKSRLLAAFHERIGGEATQWIECAGSPLFANSAFHPVAELVRQILGWRNDEPVEARLAKLGAALAAAGVDSEEAVALIAELLGASAPAGAALATLAPEERRRRLLAVLVRWLAGAAQDRPLVVVVEDLHWIDASTMELIRMLAEQQALARLMVICTARPEFQPSWPQRGHHLFINLGKLNARETRALVDGVIDQAGLDRAVVDQVIARTDGVPLFVEELTRLMLEGGAGDNDHKVPTTLVDSLAARLDRLGRAKETAQLGSVIGREFSYQLLAAVSPLPPADLNAALVRLVEAELVLARGTAPEATYRFKHALIQDAAYDALLRSERRELHARVGQVISESFPEIVEAHPELLAGHWAGAGEDDKAIAAYREAAQRAAARAAHVEAASHLQAALALVRRRAEGQARAGAELPLLLGLAVSLAATKGYTAPEVGVALAEARAICDSLGNVAGLFAVLIGLCNFHSVAGDMAAATEAALHCQRIGEETGLPAHRIQASFVVGYCHYSKGELVEARHGLERAAALYLEHDGGQLAFFSPTDPLVECLSTLPIVLYALGETDQAAERAEALLAHARARQRPFELAYALAFRWVYDTLARDVEASLAHADEELALCEAHGYANFRAVAATMKGLSIGASGEIARGLELCHSGIAELERQGILRALGLYLGEAARLHLRAGDTETALETVDRAIVSATRSLRICAPRLHLLRAEMLAGDQAAAARQAALEAAREQGATTFEQEALAALAG